MNIFQDTLRRIAERVEGAEAVSLLGVDGIPIDSWGPADGRAFESIAAELGAFVKTSQSRGATEAGLIQQIVLETDRSTAILSRVTAEYYLLLLMSRNGNSGRGRFELRKAGLALEKELL